MEYSSAERKLLRVPVRNSRERRPENGTVDPAAALAGTGRPVVWMGIHRSFPATQFSDWSWRFRKGQTSFRNPDTSRQGTLTARTDFCSPGLQHQEHFRGDRGSGARWAILNTRTNNAEGSRLPGSVQPYQIGGVPAPGLRGRVLTAEARGLSAQLHPCARDLGRDKRTRARLSETGLDGSPKSPGRPGSGELDGFDLGSSALIFVSWQSLMGSVAVMERERN